MSVPQRLSRQLERTLGAEAAEDLVNLLDGVELQRSELRGFRAEIRAEFAEFRVEMQKQISELSVALSTGLERVKTDLPRRTSLFWCAAVGSIAGLAGILR